MRAAAQHVTRAGAADPGDGAAESEGADGAVVWGGREEPMTFEAWWQLRVEATEREDLLRWAEVLGE